MIRRLLFAPRVSWSGDTISTASSIHDEETTNKSNQFQAQLLPSAANNKFFRLVQISLSGPSHDKRHLTAAYPFTNPRRS